MPHRSGFCAAAVLLISLDFLGDAIAQGFRPHQEHRGRDNQRCRVTDCSGAATQDARSTSSPNAVEEQRRKIEEARAADQREQEARTQQEVMRKRDAELANLKGLASGPATGGLRGLPQQKPPEGHAATANAVTGRLKGLPESSSTERQTLLGRDKELTLAIQRDLEAIRRLGFERRSADFEEWENLATAAQKEFEDAVKAEIVSAITSSSESALLDGFKKLDGKKINRWVTLLESRDPPMVETARILRAMRQIGDHDRAKLADDAKALLRSIKTWQRTSTVKSWADAAPVLLEIICDGFPAASHCKGFKAISKVTVASVYNNVTRRAAMNEIEKLSDLNEQQLTALVSINRVLRGHVQEQRRVRNQLQQTP